MRIYVFVNNELNCILVFLLFYVQLSNCCKLQVARTLLVMVSIAYKSCWKIITASEVARIKNFQCNQSPKHTYGYHDYLLSNLYKNTYLICIVFYLVRIYNDNSVVALVNDDKITQLHRLQIKGKTPHQFAYKDWLCVRHNKPFLHGLIHYMLQGNLCCVKTYIIHIQRRCLS